MEDLETSLADVSVEEKCYRIAKNSELGRHVVVTRNLKKGDIIFKDYPLVTAPSRESTPCCVACYRLLGMVPSLSFERVLDRYICCQLPQTTNSQIREIKQSYIHSFLSILIFPSNSKNSDSRHRTKQHIIILMANDATSCQT